MRSLRRHQKLCWYLVGMELSISTPISGFQCGQYQRMQEKMVALTDSRTVGILLSCGESSLTRTQIVHEDDDADVRFSS